MKYIFCFLVTVLTFLSASAQNGKSINSRTIKVEEQYHISGKSLSFDAWDYLSAWLKHESIRSNQENRSKAVRDRWLMNLLYHTAIRRSSVIGLSKWHISMAWPPSPDIVVVA